MRMGSYLQKETELNWLQSLVLAFLNLWLVLMCNIPCGFVIHMPPCKSNLHYLLLSTAFPIVSNIFHPLVKTHIRILLIKAFVLMDLGIVYFSGIIFYTNRQYFLPRDALFYTLTYNLPNCAKACTLEI